MEQLALYGAGDLGAEVYELYKGCAEANRGYGEVFFVDDNRAGEIVSGIPVVDFEGLLRKKREGAVKVAICIGEPRDRRKVADRLHEAGIELAILVHPTVELPESAVIGAGCIIYAGSYIGPNTEVGENTLIIRGFLGHNCKVGANCVFNANSTIACHVNIGDETFLSIGSSVRERVQVGSHVIVGVGAAVFLDVEDDLYMVGNPARPMRRNEDRQVFRG